MFQIRSDLKAHKDPLGKNTRKRTSEVAALQRSVQELSARVKNLPDNRSEDDHGRGQYPDETDSHSTRTSLDFFAIFTLRRSRKALVIELT